MSGEDTIKGCYSDFLLVSSTLTEKHIAFVHHQLFTDWSYLLAEPGNLQSSRIKMLKAKVGEAILFDRLFLLGAVDSDLIKSIFRHYVHLLMGVVWSEKSLWAAGPIN